MDTKIKKSIITVFRSSDDFSENAKEKRIAKFNKLFDFEKSNCDYGVSLIADAVEAKNAEDLEWSMYISSFFRNFEKRDLPLLFSILNGDWHEKHEDVLQIIETMRAEEAIDELYKTATRRFDYYINDQEYPLAKRCIWALWKIGTTTATDKIRELVNFDNEEVRALAIAQLSV